ncbi:MAG: STAS domain-containing protein [Solirubrobacteraceae bacterium]
MANVLNVEYPGANVVSLAGEVDAAAMPEIWSQLTSRFRGELKSLVIDLTAVTFIDSSAISALFELAQRTRQRRISYRVVAPSTRPIRSVLELAGLPDLMPVDESLADALAALPVNEA